MSTIKTTDDVNELQLANWTMRGLYTVTC